METGGLEVMLLTTTMSPVYCSITHDLPYFDLLVIFYIVTLCIHDETPHCAVRKGTLRYGTARL